jgi:SAM-dependent methyltransferase
MKRKLLDILRCPDCGGTLTLSIATATETEIEEGSLACSCGAVFPIVRAIPRFVATTNYGDSFGLQWNRFRSTQLDSHSGLPISRSRFYEFSGWQPSELKGALVLDVGCGAGRFTEISLAAGAELVAIDISNAVDACWSNFHNHPQLHVVQANLYALPFAPETFDRVYCFGVLQHTPNVDDAFHALPPVVRPGGKLAIDVYPKLWRNLFWSKYWLRPVTEKIPKETLFSLVQQATPALLQISRVLGRIPFVGRYLKYLLPVVNYDGVYPLSERQLNEWAVLDTFDMLSPTHDHPQKRDRVLEWFQSARLANVEVERRGFLVGRATKPAAH